MMRATLRPYAPRDRPRRPAQRAPRPCPAVTPLVDCVATGGCGLLSLLSLPACMEFYRSVLRFQPALHLPDPPPYVFGSVTAGGVEIFFNDQKAVAAEYPALGARPIGGSLTLFIEVQGVEEVLAAVLKSGAKITMPLKQQFYGMREFAFEDPEGWVITIAEKVA